MFYLNVRWEKNSLEDLGACGVAYWALTLEWRVLGLDSGSTITRYVLLAGRGIISYGRCLQLWKKAADLPVILKALLSASIPWRHRMTKRYS